MTSLTLSLAVQLAMVGTVPGEDVSYAKAHEVTTQTGQPMVILVGAKWCPACVQMKNAVVPQLVKQGSLAQVAFAEVDIDQERELGRQLTNGGPIPQLLMYRKTKLGWRLRRIIGGQSVEKADRFIAEGVALDKAAKVQETPAPAESARPQQVTLRPTDNPST
ncbi:MAG: thioredoxin family protein [Thermoguttaceae bacterium]